MVRFVRYAWGDIWPEGTLSKASWHVFPPTLVIDFSCDWLSLPWRFIWILHYHPIRFLTFMTQRFARIYLHVCHILLLTFTRAYWIEYFSSRSISQSLVRKRVHSYLRLLTCVLKGKKSNSFVTKCIWVPNICSLSSPTLAHFFIRNRSWQDLLTNHFS